ncbi:hypothetical protein J6590_034739 [Homalodisca vitripennis]|nr:hypothetical protein J6590_034739 [Homalodisca vitripennis]
MLIGRDIVKRDVEEQATESEAVRGVVVRRTDLPCGTGKSQNAFVSAGNRAQVRGEGTSITVEVVANLAN